MSVELSGLAHPSHGRILDIIRAAGTISRVEIADKSGMTGASVTNIVRLLLDLELVKEIGQAESTGGKRRTLLAIAPESRYAVGIHMQRASTTYTVSDMAGRMVGRRVCPELAPGDDLIAHFAHDVNALLEDLAIRAVDIVGVGVAAGHSADGGVGVDSLSAPELSRAIGMPVIVDREAIASAVGEFWQGTATQPSSFATIYMADEFGAGFVNDGTAWRGATSNAGDIGHIPVGGDDTPCGCGRRGCLQAIASPEAVVTSAEVAGVLSGSPGASIADRFDELARRAILGDDVPHRLLDVSAERLAQVAVIVADVMDVEMFILAGSGFAVAGAIYAERLRDALHRVHRKRPVIVELAHNPRDAAAIGASALVLQRALAPR